MKKFLAHLTGIVFIIAILAAGGCKSANDPGQSIAAPGETVTYPEEVTIFLKAEEEGEEIKLLMYDSKEATEKVAKDHIAYVGPGTKVVWRRANNSGIKSIKKAGPKLEEGPIFPGDAKTILLNKRRRIIIDEDTPVPIEKGTYIEEEYEIKFRDKKYKKEWNTDPYLRIEG